ncbi:hypothetical protein, partial [Oceanobacillus indicireducens]|uniref:hypothetical protein n=1 Tax=Oceanobacillus indicireducens TaxID=1004261 RepID=UPI001E32BDD4
KTTKTQVFTKKLLTIRKSMWGIINDTTIGANFVVLLLVKLNNGNMEGDVSLFLQGYPLVNGDLLREEQINDQE